MVSSCTLLEKNYENGLLASNNSKYEEAIGHFSRAIQNNPKFGSAHFQRALAKFETKNYKGAIEDFRYAIDYNSDEDAARYNIALCYQRMSMYAQSIVEYKKCVKLCKSYRQKVSSHIRVAEIYNNQVGTKKRVFNKVCQFRI